MKMPVEVETEDMPWREVLCDVDDKYGLIAVNAREQWCIDTYISTARADQLEILHERTEAAHAEHRQEMIDHLRESMRDDSRGILK